MFLDKLFNRCFNWLFNKMDKIFSERAEKETERLVELASNLNFNYLTVDNFKRIMDTKSDEVADRVIKMAGSRGYCTEHFDPRTGRKYWKWVVKNESSN